MSKSLGSASNFTPSSDMDQSFLKEWPIQDLVQWKGRYKMNSGYFVVPEIKEDFKNKQNHFKRTVEPL